MAALIWPPNDLKLAQRASQRPPTYLLLVRRASQITIANESAAADEYLQVKLSIPVTVTGVQGVSGGMARLPCVVTEHRPGDAPVLVLWYKDGQRQPIYTLDLRPHNEHEAEGREDADNGSERTVYSDDRGSLLHLRPLNTLDSGIYHCKVDFQNSPTLQAMVNLTVYETPSRLVVQDHKSIEVRGDVIGPLMEGQSLKLHCVAYGGRPPPSVSWWAGPRQLTNRSRMFALDGAPISARDLHTKRISYNFCPKNGRNRALFDKKLHGTSGYLVRTELSIPKLGREHNKANLTCKASNNNITEPIQTSITLNVYLNPSHVTIRDPGKPLVEGVEVKLTCEAKGAYPRVHLEWELTKPGSRQKAKNSPGTIAMGEGRWVSHLELVPTDADHGAELTCIAYNPDMAPPNRDDHRPAVSDSTILNVHFKPRVSLRLGSSLEGQPITEGMDVYFECDVSCNPNARSISWFKNGTYKVDQDLKAGVLVSGKNLVLQRLRRTSAGNYTCVATNDQGTTTSNVVPLAIRYQPVCLSGPQTVAVAEGESVRLTCRVDAQPNADLHFTWYFNNTIDTMEVEGHRVEVHQGYSILDYKAMSARDYGTLSCWATNTVGTQADPCRFTVVEAGPPERVRNCRLENHTVGTLEVHCEAGSNGGLVQTFIARVYAALSQTLLATLEASDKPSFHLQELTPGNDYHITIVAVNAKGSSDPEEIDAIRLKAAETRHLEAVPATSGVSPLVGVFLGLVGGFLLLLLAGVLLTRGRSFRWRNNKG
ncbi:unnamed protein product, partial [Meganyctiphanes norvegica]